MSPEADAATTQPALRRNTASTLSLKHVFWMFLFTGSFQTKADCVKTGLGLATQCCSFGADLVAIILRVELCG